MASGTFIQRHRLHARAQTIIVQQSFTNIFLKSLSALETSVSPLQVKNYLFTYAIDRLTKNFYDKIVLLFKP